MRKKDWLVAVAMALCVVGLVACGGSDSGSGGGAAATEEEAGLEFAECMREHGVEIEDPKPGENVAIDGDGDPTTKRALAACDDKLDGAGQELSASEDEEFKEGALALARCMREQGIEMGDPKFPGPGQFLLDIGGVDTESPAFRAAQDACEGLLPETSGITVGG
jgi:hypothetical protein